MTTVLVSRFLLDLQASNQRALKLDSRDPLYLSAGAGGDGDAHSQSQSQSLVFARVVGSLASSVSSGEYDDGSEDGSDASRAEGAVVGSEK